jgi:hypothetical protein
MRARRRYYELLLGVFHSAWINLICWNARLRKQRTFALHLNTASQYPHVESLLAALMNRREQSSPLLLLVNFSEIRSLRTQLGALSRCVYIIPASAARFLLFCDFFLSVDQGATYPWFGCKIRACMFHGQPSKGNVYQRLNYKQINRLYFYGPMMRDYYLKTKQQYPHWAAIPYFEVGQPLSDRFFNSRESKESSRKRLGLDPDRFTVIYAPSFEYCSSIALHGPEIIEFLLGLEINLIVKPHPAFYNCTPFSDDYNHSVPNANRWAEKIKQYNSHACCFFPAESLLDATPAICAADVMLTDYSGVAFDGIILDLGLIYWHCPSFFSEYLPCRYGVDGNAAREDMACNAGRDAGIVVENLQELAQAVARYKCCPSYRADQRKQLAKLLLFNPGNATNQMLKNIEIALGENFL